MKQKKANPENINEKVKEMANIIYQAFLG